MNSSTGKILNLQALTDGALCVANTLEGWAEFEKEIGCPEAVFDCIEGLRKYPLQG